MSSPDAVATIPARPQRKSGLFSFASSRFAGFDIFISYRIQEPDEEYALKLHEKLEAKGYRCFVCAKNQPGGTRLKAYRREAARSRMLVLVGSGSVLESRHIPAELAAHKEGRRGLWRLWGARIVPVSVDGALNRFHDPKLLLPPHERQWQPLVGRVTVDEHKDAFGKGEPTPEVIERITESYRQVRAGMLFIAGLIALAAIILLPTGGLAGWATIQRNRAEDDLGAARKQLAVERQALAGARDSIEGARDSLQDLNGDLVVAESALDLARWQAVQFGEQAAAAQAQAATARAQRDVAQGQAAEALTQAADARLAAARADQRAEASNTTAQAIGFAGLAREYGDQDPTTAVRLALHSVSLERNTVAENVLLGAYNSDDLFYTHRYGNASDADIRPDGRQIAVVRQGDSPGVYLARPGDTAVVRLDHTVDRPLGVRFVLGGERVLTWSKKGLLTLWDTGGARIAPVQQSDGGSFRGEICSPGVALLQSREGAVETWNLRTQERRALKPVRRMDAAPSARPAMAVPRRAMDRGRAALPRARFELRCAPEGTSFLQWEPGSTMVLQRDLAGTVKAEIPVGDSSVADAVFAPRGNGVAFVRGSHVGFWAGAGEVRWVSPHQDSVSSVQFSPDGRYLLSTSVDGAALLFKTGGGVPFDTVGTHLAKIPQGISSGTFGRDSRSVVLVRRDGIISMHTLSGATQHRLRGHGYGKHLAFEIPRIVHGEGNRLLTVGRDGTARLWEVRDPRWRVFRDGAGEDFEKSAAHAASGVIAVAVRRDSVTEVDVYDAAGNRETVLSGMREPLRTLEFSLNGTLLAHTDSAIRLWTRGQPPVVIEAEAPFAGNAGFSATGDTVYQWRMRTVRSTAPDTTPDTARAWTLRGERLPDVHPDSGVVPFDGLKRRQADAPGICARFERPESAKEAGFYLRSADDRNRLRLTGHLGSVVGETRCSGSHAFIHTGAGIEVFFLDPGPILEHFRRWPGLWELDADARGLYGLTPPAPASAVPAPAPGS